MGWYYDLQHTTKYLQNRHSPHVSEMDMQIKISSLRILIKNILLIKFLHHVIIVSHGLIGNQSIQFRPLTALHKTNLQIRIHTK